LPEFYGSEPPGAVFSTAIDKFVYVLVKKRFNATEWRLSYKQSEEVSSIADIKNALIRESLLDAEYLEPCEIATLSDISTIGTGLGGSSAIAVGLVKTLTGEQDRTSLAERAYHIERDRVGQRLGKQDQYIAAFGGMNTIEFDSRECRVTPALIPAEVRDALEKRLLLFCIGDARPADPILADCAVRVDENLRALFAMRQQAFAAEAMLRSGRLEWFGRMLDDAWALKKALSPLVTTADVDAAYEAACAAGALGGKLCGAGGSGFLLLYVPEEKQVAVRAALARLPELPFGFWQDGAEVIWRAPGW